MLGTSVRRGIDTAVRRGIDTAVRRGPLAVGRRRAVRPGVIARLGAGLRGRLREWARRYLPAEIVGTVTALAAAVTVHGLTGSLAPAALAGSVAETVAYYSVILRRAVPSLYATHAGAGPARRLVRTGRSLLAEMSDFVAAELADTFVVRPGLICLAAGWTGRDAAGAGLPAGLLIGKLLADLAFYAVVIPSYELRKRVMRR